MNFTQLHERLRSEIKRSIDRGDLTGTSLAARTGLQPSHISNFLHKKRNLSSSALDRVLEALAMDVDHLIPSREPSHSRGAPGIFHGPINRVPLVSPTVAASSPLITSSLTLETIEITGMRLEDLRSGLSHVRRNWQRFVALRLSADQALPMSPILRPQSIVIVDRHYVSLTPHDPHQPTIYGVTLNGSVIFRYLTLDPRCLVLRPHVLRYPVDLLEIGQGKSPYQFIVGRVAICISQL
jgi:transcriptional regulator with XRE-family HTH domain